MKRLAVGLLGLGTVGGEIARRLIDEPESVERRARRAIDLKRIAVRSLDKPRPFAPPPEHLTDDWRRVVEDPTIDVVVELMGGIEPSRAAILTALEAGKHVVTANKALLADHGAEIFEAARQADRAVAFEAAVAGGIPIVSALGVALAANRFRSLAAILNGTCNFILTAMTRERLSYDEALARSQRLGYAEADPTLDVDGTDTAHKLAILAQLAFGASVTTERIPREGINQLQPEDIEYAGELGYVVKLLAIARDLGDDGLELRVAPTLVKRGKPLADVSGPFNAIRLASDPVGETLFSGQGAGARPTASAILGDLIDVAVGRAALTSKSLELWPEMARPARLCAPSAARRRSYLRFMIADRPGVLGSIAQVLGHHHVSIASVIQHDPGDDDLPDAPVPLVFMTHAASEADLNAALEAIDRLEPVHPPSVRLGVED